MRRTAHVASGVSRAVTSGADARCAQVPTLETPEGGIFESNAIARYVARLAGTGLLGATPVQAVRAGSGVAAAAAAAAAAAWARC